MYLCAALVVILGKVTILSLFVTGHRPLQADIDNVLSECAKRLPPEQHETLKFALFDSVRCQIFKFDPHSLVENTLETLWTKRVELRDRIVDLLKCQNYKTVSEVIKALNIVPKDRLFFEEALYSAFLLTFFGELEKLKVPFLEFSSSYSEVCLFQTIPSAQEWANEGFPESERLLHRWHVKKTAKKIVDLLQQKLEKAGVPFNLQEITSEDDERLYVIKIS